MSTARENGYETQGPERMTSSPSNPKPGTLVNLSAGSNRNSDYVIVGRYRVRRLRNGWNLYIANDAGQWGRPTWHRTKERCEAAINEHIGKGTTDLPRINLQARVARLEKRIAELEERLGPP